MFSQYWIARVPGSTITAAQSVILQGLADVTATGTEINAGVDGLTATAAELNNKLDGSKSYVALASTSYADAYSVLAANTGKVHFIPNSTENVTFTLPTAAAGLNYEFVYVGGADDAEDWVIDAGSNTNFFVGGIEHQDTDGELIATEYSNGSSESKLTLDKPGAGTVVSVQCSGTSWYIWGRSVSATIPAFSS